MISMHPLVQFGANSCMLRVGIGMRGRFVEADFLLIPCRSRPMTFRSSQLKTGWGDNVGGGEEKVNEKVKEKVVRWVNSYDF
jgi:hypothetical protein